MMHVYTATYSTGHSPDAVETTTANGMLTHENPIQPIASDSMSASIAGYELPVGK